MPDLDLSQFEGHTPGDWAMHDGGRFGQYGDQGPSICAAGPDGACQPLFELAGPGDIRQCEANSRLCAAAPALLAEVKELREIVRLLRKEKIRLLEERISGK